MLKLNIPLNNPRYNPYGDVLIYINPGHDKQHIVTPAGLSAVKTFVC